MKQQWHHIKKFQWIKFGLNHPIIPSPPYAYFSNKRSPVKQAKLFSFSSLLACKIVAIIPGKVSMFFREKWRIGWWTDRHRQIGYHHRGDKRYYPHMSLFHPFRRPRSSDNDKATGHNGTNTSLSNPRVISLIYPHKLRFLFWFY